MWYFCAALHAFAGYRGLSRACILREISTKSCNADSSLDCILALVNPTTVGQQVLAVVFLTFVDSLLCPTSIFSQPPVLFCLPSSILSLFSLRPSFSPPLLVSWEISPPCSFVWVSRPNRQRDRLSGANTNGNELLRIVSQSKWLIYRPSGWGDRIRWRQFSRGVRSPPKWVYLVKQ